MAIRIPHAVRRSVACGLTYGLALVVAGCASEPSSRSGLPAEPTPASLAERIGVATKTIQADYVDPVEERTLLNACYRKLPVPTPASETHTVDTDDHSFYDIASVLIRLTIHEADVAADSCIRGMVESLGGRSQFLDAEDFSFLKGTSHSTASIGLQLESAPDGAKIIGAFEGAPAASADIASGDLLTAVDDVDLKGRALNDITRLLRGTPGSSVTITVRRAGSSAPLHLTLIRQILLVKSFDGRVVKQGFIYLKTSHLTERMPNEMAETITRLRRENQGAFRGIILDLRACPGGLLRGAIALSAAFLPPGTLVAATKGKAPDSDRRYSADPRDYWHGSGANPLADLPPELKSTPIVALIGPQTAAGCEIVASALQDHRRAIVIGERSYGNGSIQTIIPLLPRSEVTQPALKLTTARIYRLSGESLDGKGVEPDVVVPWAMKLNDGAPKSPRAALFGSSDDPVATRALEILKSDSPGRRQER